MSSLIADAPAAGGTTPTAVSADWNERLRLRLELEEFNVAYCRALDEYRLQDWAEFFTEDALYVVTGRENHDAGMPVGLVYCEGKGMIQDRALAIAETMMFAPRYLRHLVTNLHIAQIGERKIQAEANFALLQTLYDRPETRFHLVGRYIDTFSRGDDGGLLLSKRICVYDTLLLDNALVYPV